MSEYSVANKTSQNDKLMEALMRGETLTPLRALIIAGTLRLSERIRELESEGVPIIHERTRVGKKIVMGYYLAIAHG